MIVNTFLLFYLTSACGMAGSLAGLALAITLVIEAGTTPLFRLSVRSHPHQVGRRRHRVHAVLPRSRWRSRSG